MRLATQDRLSISVSSMPGAKWDTIAGQELTREVPKLRVEAGGAKFPMPTRPEYSDLTITKVYDQDTDAALFKSLMLGNKYEGSTIVATEIDQDGNVISGNSMQFTGCVVKSVSRDDGDANGQDPLKMTVVWAVGGVA